MVQVSAAPSSGQQFLGFSGGLSGTANPQNLTMTGPHGVTGIFSSSSNYFLTANPASQSGVAGGGLNYSIGVNLPSGSTIALSASGLPSGAGATFSPASLSGPGTTTMSITVGANVAQGTYAITVTATNGALSRTAIAILVVVSPDPANIMTPASGSYLTGTVTFVWDAGAGVSQYSLSLGSTPNGTEYYSANLGTAQSATVAIPSNQTGTLYATLGSLVAGTWQTRTATYRLDPPTSTTMPTMAAHAEISSPPNSHYAYNDGTQSSAWPYRLDPSDADATHLDENIVIVVQNGQIDKNVSAVMEKKGIASDNGMNNGLTVKFTATRQASPGWRGLVVYFVCPSSGYLCIPGHYYPYFVPDAVYVYDATPIIDGVGYDPPDYPGGPFYVTVEGRYLGMGGTVSLCPTGAYPCDQAAGRLDAYLDINGPKTSWSPRTAWTYDPEKGTNKIVALLTPPYGAAGDYDAQVTVSTGGTGLPFAGGPQQAQPGKSNQKGTVSVSAQPVTTLVSFGWGNNQELWKADTYASNGESISGTPITDSNGVRTGTVVWQVPTAQNNNTSIDEPAALAAGSDAPYLSRVTLQTSAPGVVYAELQVLVSPADIELVTQPFQFVNGTFTLSNLNLARPLPSVIANTMYQFTWRIRYSQTGAFQTFKVTNHKVYLMKGLIDNANAQYRITTKRLDRVTSFAQGNVDLSRIVGAVINNLIGTFDFDGSQHLTVAQQTNVWAAVDSPVKLDCESLSAIGAAELQQLGYSSATVRKAYPTGAAPPGDTDATSEETMVNAADGKTYKLTFQANFFEGFIYLSSPDTTENQPMSATVVPVSDGPLMEYTGCTVSPVSRDNLIAFRVLTSTYRKSNITFQEWGWCEPGSNGTCQLLHTLEDGPQVPLPRENCPPTEVAQ